MKKNSSTRSAFFNPRALFGFFLLFAGVLLALFGALTGRPAQAQGASQTQAAPRTQAANTYTGEHCDPRPVIGVHTPALRDMPLIPPRLAPHRTLPEPPRPPPPVDTGKADTAHQSFVGAAVWSPIATGISFEGVGVGIPGFVSPRDSAGHGRPCWRDPVRPVEQLQLRDLG